MQRKTFLQTLAAATGAGVLTGLYTWQVEPFWLEFVRVQMPIRQLPEALVGKTLMQISDMHVGNRFDRKYLIESMQKAQQLAPDFVVYTGDFVNYESPEQFAQLEEVMAHAVHGTLGTAGVLGNHDYGLDWKEEAVADRVTDILSARGIRMLRNEQIDVHGLSIIGLDDWWATNFKPELVLQSLPQNKPQLVLCHNPDVADLPIWNGYQGWILSGHTHGGQCKAPFLRPPLLPVRNKKYVAGQVDLGDGRTLYINRALGHLIQVRFNVRPEITLFELVKG
ncbi:metallophosphoesterase [Arundinibacter roseus]|uniref:Phosphoesterase n=1 Tax=Arundinibacter roseus TaxID=2070510 RepID=A0A4V2XA09_9BACT|nr:metallophosphoesterase [Arundinibacter roseus]TDB65785.1 phosphoesterase [Arundinibacter roseus]